MSTLGMSYQEIVEQIDNKVKEAVKEFYENPSVVYSAYEYDEWDKPIDNLSEVPVKDKIKFISEDGEWESTVIDSPTWLQIAVIANRMINETKDYKRHFKDFNVFEEKDGVLIANFIMEY